MFGLLQSSLGINILPLVLQKQLIGYENIHILLFLPPFTLPKLKLNISNLGVYDRLVIRRVY
jgi:hypothetical protein